MQFAFVVFLLHFLVGNFLAHAMEVPKEEEPVPAPHSSVDASFKFQPLRVYSFQATPSYEPEPENGRVCLGRQLFDSCISPSGEHIAFASKHGIFVHDAQTGFLVYSIPKQVNALAFADQEGSTLAFTKCRQKKRNTDNIRLWNLLDGKQVMKVRADCHIADLWFASKTQCFVVEYGDGSFELRDSKTCNRFFRAFQNCVMPEINFLNFNANERMIATNFGPSNEDENAIQIIHIGRNEYPQELSCTFLKKHVIIDDISDDAPPDDDDDENFATKILFGNFHPCEDKIVTAGYDDRVYVFDTNSGQCLHRLEGHTLEVLSAEFAQDGRKLISSDEDNIKLWDAKSGALIKTIHLNELYPQKSHLLVNAQVKLSPDGALIAARLHYQNLAIFDSDSGALLYTISYDEMSERVPRHRDLIADFYFLPGHIERRDDNGELRQEHNNLLLMRSVLNDISAVLLPTRELTKPNTLRLKTYVDIIKNYMNTLKTGQKPSHAKLIKYVANFYGSSCARAKEIESACFNALNIYSQRYLRLLIPGREVERTGLPWELKVEEPPKKKLRTGDTN